MTITDLRAYNKTVGINHAMGVEGGRRYTDIKTDRGGKTRFGITEAVAKEHEFLWAKFGFNGVMSELPEALAFAIYEHAYWNKLRLDDIVIIHPLIADRMLDIGINRGVGNAGMYLQRLLNVFNMQGVHYPDIKVDGDVGPKTIECLKALCLRRGHEGKCNIVVGLMSLQNNSYIAIAENNPTQEDFSFGWSNRVLNAFKMYIPLLEKPF